MKISLVTRHGLNRRLSCNLLSRRNFLFCLAKNEHRISYPGMLLAKGTYILSFSSREAYFDNKLKRPRWQRSMLGDAIDGRLFRYSVRAPSSEWLNTAAHYDVITTGPRAPTRAVKGNCLSVLNILRMNCISQWPWEFSSMYGRHFGMVVGPSMHRLSGAILRMSFTHGSYQWAFVRSLKFKPQATWGCVSNWQLSLVNIKSKL